MLTELIAMRPTNRAALPSWYRSLFTAQEDEGLTIADLASASGISAANLYLQRRQLRRPERQGLVRVAVSNATAAAVHGPRAATGFELQLSASRTLTIPVGFNADELQRMLRALSWIAMVAPRAAALPARSVIAFVPTSRNAPTLGDEPNVTRTTRGERIWAVVGAWAPI